jgi:hypothetical protein
MIHGHGHGVRSVRKSVQGRVPSRHAYYVGRSIRLVLLYAPHRRSIGRRLHPRLYQFQVPGVDGQSKNRQQHRRRKRDID